MTPIWSKNLGLKHGKFEELSQKFRYWLYWPKFDISIGIAEHIQHQAIRGNNLPSPSRKCGKFLENFSKLIASKCKSNHMIYFLSITDVCITISSIPSLPWLFFRRSSSKSFGESSVKSRIFESEGARQMRRSTRRRTKGEFKKVKRSFLSQYWLLMDNINLKISNRASWSFKQFILHGPWG